MFRTQKAASPINGLKVALAMVLFEYALPCIERSAVKSLSYEQIDLCSPEANTGLDNLLATTSKSSLWDEVLICFLQHPAFEAKS